MFHIVKGVGLMDIKKTFEQFHTSSLTLQQFSDAISDLSGGKINTSQEIKEIFEVSLLNEN